MSVRMSHRRRARQRATVRRPEWSPPQLFSYFERIADGALFEVTGLFQRDRQVRLESSRLGETVHADPIELQHDWRAAV